MTLYKWTLVAILAFGATGFGACSGTNGGNDGSTDRDGQDAGFAGDGGSTDGGVQDTGFAGDGGDSGTPVSECGFSVNHVGVPCPDPLSNTLPSGIMPDLPVPNSAPGWAGYNPLTIPTPERQRCTSSYAEGESVPRNLTLAAGDVVCFTGMATATGKIHIDAGACRAEAPCWLVGLDGGGILSSALPAIEVSGKHLLMDGLRLEVVRSAIDILPGSTYITVRRCEIKGDGSDGGGAGIDITGDEQGEIRYVMIYGNKFDDIGPNDGGPLGGEAHQVRPSWFSRYVWVVENVFGDSDGDAVQCGNSKTPTERRNEGMNAAKSPHYVWIAGNRHEGISENFVDLKNSYHVIISGNNVTVPVRETVIILSQDSEGFWTGYHWAIGNRLVGGGSECIGVRGSEENLYGTFYDYNFVIANTAWDCRRGLLSFQSGNSQTAGPETYVLYNTFVSNVTPPFTARAPVYKVQNRQENRVEFIGNIFYGNFNPLEGSGGASYITANNYLTVTFIAYDNLYYQVDGVDLPFLSRINATVLEQDGNINADPMFTDEAAGDFSLAPDSPARQATDRSSVAFSLFRELYGLDIQRPLGLDGVNNIGAVQ